MQNPFEQINERLDSIEYMLKELGQKIPPPSEAELNDLLTAEGAAEFLSNSIHTIYQLTSQNKIPFMKKGKRLYFSKSELFKWLEESKKESVDEVMLSIEKNLSSVRRKRRGGS